MRTDQRGPGAQQSEGPLGAPRLRIGSDGYGQLSRSVSNSTVAVPFALMVTWATKWSVRCEPSEPLTLTWPVKVAVKVLLLTFSPSQKVAWPVSVGWLGSLGTNVKVPVTVVVSCEVPLGSSVMWLTPLSVWVAVPGAPEHGFTSGALSVPLKWTVVVWAWAKAAIGLSRATSNPATATPATIRTRMGLPPSPATWLPVDLERGPPSHDHRGRRP